MVGPRFVRDVRFVVELARDEAAALGADRVDRVEAEHLLLGVARCGGGAADALADEGIDLEDIHDAIVADEADALAAVGISLASVRVEVEERFGRGAWDQAGTRARRLRPSGEAKAALEHAVREARRLGSPRIEPAHVLLALLAQPGRAAEVVRAAGGDPYALRRRVQAALAR